jgi:hypothetical protein
MSGVPHIDPLWIDSGVISICPIKEEPEFGVFKGLAQWSKIDKKNSQSSHSNFSPTIFETGYFDGTEQVGPAYPESDSLPSKLTPLAFDKSFDKCKGSKFWYDPDMMDPEVWEGVFNETVGKMKPRLLTLTEAAVGIVEWQNFHSVDLSTSAGYPWKLYGYTRDDLIKRDSDNPNVEINHRSIEQLTIDYPKESEIIDYPHKDGKRGLWMHPALQSYTYFRVHHAANGRMVPAHYLAAVKSELRPKLKVLDSISRLFKAGALDHLLFVRMTMGQFIAFHERDPFSDCAVGIDPQSSDWSRIYHKMTDVNENIDEGDHSSWDLHLNSNTLAPTLPEKFREFFQMKRENPLYNCFRTAVYTGVVGYIVVKDKIYIMLGQNSGQPATTWINSAWNSATKRSAWKRRWILRLKTSYEVIPFRKACALTTYGDDFLLAVLPKFLEEFDTQKLAIILRILFNQEITTSSKSKIIPPTTHISQANYLQRKFKNVDGAILAPLNEDSLRQMVRYNDKPSAKAKMTKRDLLVQIAHGACHEWVLHGREKFEANKKIINKYLGHLNLALQFKYSFDELLQDKLSKAVS